MWATRRFDGRRSFHLAGGFGASTPIQRLRPPRASCSPKAGLRERVTLLRARASDAIPTLQRELDGRRIDVLFIDHAKQEYLPDLKRVEEAGLLRAGSVIAADNVVFFGLDDYVDHVRNSGRYSSSRTYTASLEYDGRPKGEAFADGVEVSVYKG